MRVPRLFLESNEWELLSDKDEGQLLAFSQSYDPSATASADGDNIYIRYGDDEMSIPIDPHTDLPGEHNKKNLMAALIVSVLNGLRKDEIVAALGSYQRPRHRSSFLAAAYS